MEDQRDIFRSLIRHEDELRSQRLGWMLTASGFLFAAIAFAWANANSLALVVVIAAVGISISISTLVGLHASTTAIRLLRDRAEAHEVALRNSGSADTTDAPVVGITPDELRTTGRLTNATVFRLFEVLYPWRFIPVMLTLVWIVVALLGWLEL